MTKDEVIQTLITIDSGYSPNFVVNGHIAIGMAIKALKQESVLDKIRAEILVCLNALDDIEKSGFNIYLPNEISGRRLTYEQCLEFIDKYKAESEVSDANSN